jgi:CarD family transcriptional regulator
MFNVGDMAVYPAHGVGLIEAIEEKRIGEQRHIFYVMRILENDLKILIPKSNAEQVGLRCLISGTEIDKVYAILQDKEIQVTSQTWNRRYREYMEKIKTGSVFYLAEVYRDLFIIQMDKALSFGEKKMFETAKNLLVKEISIAQNKSENEISTFIESMISLS